jgi:hypothetical protein
MNTNEEIKEMVKQKYANCFKIKKLMRHLAVEVAVVVPKCNIMTDDYDHLKVIIIRMKLQNFTSIEALDYDIPNRELLVFHQEMKFRNFQTIRNTKFDGSRFLQNLRKKNSKNR